MTDLAEKLAAPLNASRVKQRTNGRGGTLSYLETHDAIRAANTIFGFGKWGHEIVELRSIPGVAFTKDGKTGLHVGYVCIVRLTVEGCVPTSGVGYGDASEYRDVAPVTAHELAAKEAESDALKRALKNFGDQFGLALYDKAVASSGHVTNTAPAPQRAAAKAAIAPKISDEEKLRVAEKEQRVLDLVREKADEEAVAKTTVSIDTSRGRPTPHDHEAWLDKAIDNWEKKFVAPKNVKVPAGAA